MSSGGRADARFDFAPPRNFLLPALLLLIAEEPSHGYQLVKDVQELRFGTVDRPSVYRALGQLADDELVEDWSEDQVAGSPRRVYGITAKGIRALSSWMGVIKDERDVLDGVIRRYTASGSVDALIAEAGRGLVAVGGCGIPSVSTTYDHDQRPRLVDSHDNIDLAVGDRHLVRGPIADGRHRFELVADRSAVLIEARSTVGPITFGALDVAGWVEADVVNGAVVDTPTPSAHVEIPIDRLRSGNALYDAELARRMGAKKFPVAALELTACAAVGVDGRFRLSGSVSLHGVERDVDGVVAVGLADGERLSVSGDHVFDIRDFGIELPTVLMLRIYPDVTVRLHVDADWVPREESRLLAGPG